MILRNAMYGKFAQKNNSEVKIKMSLTQEEKIDFGQCFSLAVDLNLKDNPTVDMGERIIDQSIDLFFIKQKAKMKLEKIKSGNLRIKDTLKENLKN